MRFIDGIFKNGAAERKRNENRNWNRPFAAYKAFYCALILSDEGGYNAYSKIKAGAEIYSGEPDRLYN